MVSKRRVKIVAITLRKSDAAPQASQNHGPLNHFPQREGEDLVGIAYKVQMPRVTVNQTWRMLGVNVCSAALFAPDLSVFSRPASNRETGFALRRRALYVLKL
jgi:hypothetical protein